MKVAIVHDWLVTSGGAEKVLEQMIACFPQADIFSLVDFLEDRSIVHNKPVKTSFIQRLPYAKKKYRGVFAADAACYRTVSTYPAMTLCSRVHMRWRRACWLGLTRPM